MKTFPVTVTLTALLAIAAAAIAEELVTLQTRDGATQSFLLTVPAAGKPAAAAILFPGSYGDTRLRHEDGQIKLREGNFLVRSRQFFVGGGNPATSDPCEAFSAHGFLGKEPEAVAAMVNWMLKKPYRSNID